ncbi:hypothetical protein Q4512_06845 [Oceanihabitans sp. 2_MG-2023]|uniref:hypothetical protein n=1 Tax=Oceanihabitans sp. 2_MG-2023 TaxID=3062661 RepID=UPI0026E4389A|nr:hypothetical protein [Oceanihabitans sp. 2_MG-2023]MDO6596626.1 hypothetical protein [Oceanihabitans sp. 2_MG-2023]
MSKRAIHYITFSLFSLVSFGQEVLTTTNPEDLINVDYEIYPNVNDVQIKNKTVAINFASLLDTSKFNFGLNYTYNTIDFNDHDTHNDFNAFEELHTIQAFAQYKKALINTWDAEFTIAPYIYSTLNKKITKEDFVLSYKANFIKTWDKNGLKSYLKLGAGYGSLFGKPNFYPIISYTSTINEKFKYEIGIPVTGAYYKINNHNTLQITAKPESIYANNASNFMLDTNEMISDSKLEFKAIKLALGYSYRLDKNWTTKCNVGYLTNSELTIKENDNKIYDFDSTESLSINVGLSFNLNKK